MATEPQAQTEPDKCDVCRDKILKALVDYVNKLLDIPDARLETLAGAVRITWAVSRYFPEPQPQHVTEEELDYMRKLRDLGFSMRLIGIGLNRSTDTVWRALNEFRQPTDVLICEKG